MGHGGNHHGFAALGSLIDQAIKFMLSNRRHTLPGLLPGTLFTFLRVNPVGKLRKLAVSTTASSLRHRDQSTKHLTSAVA